MVVTLEHQRGKLHTSPLVQTLEGMEDKEGKLFHPKELCGK